MPWLKWTRPKGKGKESKVVLQLEDAERNLETIRNLFISLLEKLQEAEERALRMLPNLM